MDQTALHFPSSRTSEMIRITLAWTIIEAFTPDKQGTQVTLHRLEMATTLA